MKPSKWNDGVIGAALGFGAPIGSLILRSAFDGEKGLEWVRQELMIHSFFYLYMLLTTPVVFAAFGFALGALRDRVACQKERLENLALKLEHQSVTDDTTGIYNHRYLMNEIRREIERTNRYDRSLSGLMIDLDHFKKVNDTYGHLAGDRLLNEVASVLNQSIRRVDTLGRYGGDEFMVILPETKPEAAQTVAQRIQKNVREHVFHTSKKSLAMTVSIGLFSLEDGESIDAKAFIEKIDQALFQAKTSGKNRIISFSV